MPKRLATGLLAAIFSKILWTARHPVAAPEY
jgi:hypothetical protein